MDKMGADFYNSVETIKERLTDKAIPIELPNGASDTFAGVVSLEWEKWVNVVEHEIPEELKAKAEEYREALIDRVSLYDDELAEKYLEGEEISVDLLKRAIRIWTCSGDLFPVMCGSALGNKWVQLMIDAVVDFLPSPLDRGEIVGTDPDDPEKQITRKSDVNQPASAIAFKIMTDPFVGTLTYVRVYSGVIKSGDMLLNPITGQKERVGRLLMMHANKREEITEISAGHICAFLWLKDTRTYDIPWASYFNRCWTKVKRWSRKNVTCSCKTIIRRSYFHIPFRWRKWSDYYLWNGRITSRGTYRKNEKRT